MNTTRRPLTSGWRFRELNPRGGSEASDLPWLPAQVPGHVHLDLLRAGVIQDPFTRMAERSCAWVDETDWVYETEFEVDDPAPPHAYLLFHGLDTIAEIFLNEEPLGHTDNMFIPHEFPVSGRLKPGLNSLRVIFRSALRVGRERQQAWADSGNDTLAPHWFVWGARSFVRKAQYMYGWDWGPELVSCGIWRPVELVTVPVARILDWKYDVEFVGGTHASPEKALVHVAAVVERSPEDDEEVTLLASLWAETEAGFRPTFKTAGTVEVLERQNRSSVTISLSVDAPVRWWPAGHDPAGQGVTPALYYVRLELKTNGGTVDCLEDATIGLRTVELVREEDEDSRGESFKFRVNGVDIFAKGANWIPCDSFPGRIEQEWERDAWTKDDRIGIVLTQARDAGFNMLRVWGGGLYESEHFYRWCDLLGILVWQDFPYGCAYYPDAGDYAEAARKEATAAVRHIRNHPSLALWCGNNENHMMYNSAWEGKESRAPRYLGERIYHEILPEVVAAEDPKTPYWPSSPYGGENPNSPDVGDRHDWDVWHGVGDWVHYVEDDSRFVSEFGFAASCGMKAWDRCLAPGDRWPASPAVRWHDRTRKGYDTYLDFIRLHFPDPQTLEDLVYYSQLNQAEAMKCGVEHWRRRKGRCWGTLIWQLNDCWPAQSWSLIDSELEPKAAYYAAKRFYAPVLLSLVRNGDDVEARLTSDLPEHIQGDVTVSIESLDGDLLTSETLEAYVEAIGTANVGSISVASVKAHARDVYVYARFEPYWELPVKEVENFHFLAEPKDLRLADAGLAWDVSETDDAFVITFHSSRFAPYVWWRLSEGVPGLYDLTNNDNFFHLRAGCSKTVTLEKAERLKTVDNIRSRLLVRTL
jgi:beta-mannosidase